MLPSHNDICKWHASNINNSRPLARVPFVFARWRSGGLQTGSTTIRQMAVVSLCLSLRRLLKQHTVKMSQSENSSHSQSSQLSDNALDAIVNGVRPKNTERSTKWGMSKFIEWCDKRTITCDLNTVLPDEFANVLRRFYAELKTIKRELYSPSALTGIRSAIQRAISSPPYNRNFNIIADREFTVANKMFVAMCKMYTQEGNRKPQHKSPIAPGDMVKLAEYFTSHNKSPDVLVEATWFMLCFHFGRRGRKGWTAMTKDTFTFETDSTGMEYLTTKITETTKNHRGGHKQTEQDYSDQRMYGSAVAVYRLYLSKLNPDCPRLFQTPLRSYRLTGESWFKNEPMGKSTLGNIMQRISKKCGLNKIYTCHSVRVSTITTLFQAGVPSQEIVTITKHKRESSLTPYISGTSEQQKRINSKILDASLGLQVNTTYIGEI